MDGQNQKLSLITVSQEFTTNFLFHKNRSRLQSQNKSNLIRVVGMEAVKRRRGNIPQEIVEEILMKLPVKSLLRFKAVSREWRGSVESKYFIEKHKQYHKSLQVRMVVFSEEKIYNGLALENMLVSASGIIHVSPYLPIRAFNRFDGYKISEPCDGLVCLYTQTRIFNLFNPATTSRRRIPKPTSFISDGTYVLLYMNALTKYVRIFTNYRVLFIVRGGHRVRTLLGIGRENSVSPRYKLLWFFDFENKRVNKSTRCMVFALDSNTWRYVDPPNCRVHYDHPLIHLDGVMYCFTHSMENQSYIEKDLKLLAFDLHTETSQSISITPDIGCRYGRELSMCVLGHRLCIFKRFVVDNDRFFNIWGLDVHKRSWEIMYSIDMSCFPPEFKERSIIPMATINNYLIISNYMRTIWVLYRSKSSILYRTSFSFNFVKSYFETLVSPYQ